MFTLKPISPDSVSGALAKAERYRLLNEPGEAESICRDILAIEPDHQQALISLILSLTEQIPQDAHAFGNALSLVDHLQAPYDRAYFAGIAWERRAKARHHGGGQGAHPYAYEWILKALELFEEAEALRAAGNDDAVLRWNACVRYLGRHKELVRRSEDVPEPIVSE
ncbi:MAG TPA: hypothetical protein VE959_03975 [Bryobacteraceae bacterium]|nr:hypothetical protein [Bryobacteraceae bacterium]